MACSCTRMAMPLGGLIGEAWIFPRALAPAEIRADFLAKRDKYHPALPAVPTPIRTMNAHPAARLWKKTPTAKDWPEQRAAIVAEVMKLLGRFPPERVPLAPENISEEDCGTYLRR